MDFTYLCPPKLNSRTVRKFEQSGSEHNYKVFTKSTKPLGDGDSKDPRQESCVKKQVTRSLYK